MLAPTTHEANQFAFTCPIFNVETKIKACVQLRRKVYRGERVEVRRGCQACLTAGKCPVGVIVQKIAFDTKGVAEQFASDQPVVGKLSAPVLDRILPVIVQDATIQRLGVPVAEMKLIATANERIRAQLATAPGKSKARATFDPAPAKPGKAVRRSGVVKAQTETPDAIASAAETGDLSAAINEVKE